MAASSAPSSVGLPVASRATSPARPARISVTVSLRDAAGNSGAVAPPQRLRLLEVAQEPIPRPRPLAVVVWNPPPTLRDFLLCRVWPERDGVAWACAILSLMVGLGMMGGAFVAFSMLSIVGSLGVIRTPNVPCMLQGHYGHDLPNTFVRNDYLEERPRDFYGVLMGLLCGMLVLYFINVGCMYSDYRRRHPRD